MVSRRSKSAIVFLVILERLTDPPQVKWSTLSYRFALKEDQRLIREIPRSTSWRITFQVRIVGRLLTLAPDLPSTVRLERGMARALVINASGTHRRT